MKSVLLNLPSQRIEKKAEIQSVAEEINIFTNTNEYKQVHQLDDTEVTLESVEKQITIIPPTTQLLVTEVHSTHSKVSKASAGINSITGEVGSLLIPGVESVELQLTQQQQIELDIEATIVTVNIGINTILSETSVAQSSISYSKVLTEVQVYSDIVSGVESTDILLTQEQQIEIVPTISFVTFAVERPFESFAQSVIGGFVNTDSVIKVKPEIKTENKVQSVTTNIVQNPQSRIDTISSSIVTFTEAQLTRVAIKEFQTISDPVVHHHYREITSTVADLNTFATTISMVLGGVGATASGGVEIDYRYAFVDFIIEEYVLQKYVIQRNGNQVNLAQPYNQVVRRDGSITTVENRNQNTPPGFEDYNLGNAGLTLGAFENNFTVDSGVCFWSLYC